MTDTAFLLIGTAFSLALVHTCIGPDHYLPFIILSKSEKWSLKKTLLWTLLCGTGHVASSIAIGGLGIWLGWNISSMTWFEGMRGDLASWALLIFGFGYMFFGLARGLKGHKHSHVHIHENGDKHKHVHDHDNPNCSHQSAHKHNKTFWALFVIFVLGPCEPLIPLLMVPASKHSVATIVAVASVFAITTLITMCTCVLLGYFGIRLFDFKRLNQYAHALSGFALGISGVLMVTLGL